MEVTKEEFLVSCECGWEEFHEGSVEEICTIIKKLKYTHDTCSKYEISFDFVVINDS